MVAGENSFTGIEEAVRNQKRKGFKQNRSRDAKLEKHQILNRFVVFPDLSEHGQERCIPDRVGVDFQKAVFQVLPHFFFVG